MLRLKEYISNTLTLLKALKEQKNRYYYNSASGVKGTYQTTFTVCTLENLPKGVYLVLGKIGVSVGSSSIISSTIMAVENCELLISSTTSRTTMTAGGGCTSWALAEVAEGNGSVRITTYKYYNSSSAGYAGHLVAIKLI